MRALRHVVSQSLSDMITKSERYREILAVLARHGIGVVDDEFIKHEAGEQARAEHLRRACEELTTCARLIGFEPSRIVHIKEGARFLGVPIHFVIADGIVAMEGNGPLNGTPRALAKLCSPMIP